MVRLRWPDGVVICPTCGGKDVTWMPTRSLYQCKGKHPKRQFSVKVGTIFEDSPISLGKWLLIGWMLANCRNGISSHEVARTIGITQKSAWFMLHRLRTAAQEENHSEPLFDEVECDETFIGGKVGNMHTSRKPKGTGFSGKPVGAMAKTTVMGILQRGGNVRAMVVKNHKRKHLQAEIQKHVAPGSTLYTDDLHSYRGLPGYVHHYVDHATKYVSGQVHTNGLENFWSLLKRCIKGTYIQVRPEHLQAYVAEQVFRYNTRKKLDITEQQRFSTLLEGTTGKRLTYEELISR
ncbi:MAG: IS1595 family transposase [Puia sp.]|nr:IS1595 family transposase [Puia sp.]